jgi:hypothetical protein
MAGVAGSSKQQYPGARTNMPEVLNIIGTFQTNGAAPVRTFGRGYTVTQQGTGIYRVTFNINTPRMVAITAALIKASTSQTFLEVINLLATNNYIEFRVVNNAGTAVAPGAVGDLISFDANIMTVKLPVS